MHTNTLLAVLTLISLVACKKQESSPASGGNSPVNTPAVAVPLTPPAPVSIAPPEIVATAPSPPADFAALNQALQLWVPINGFPKDLNDLVKAKFIPQLPSLPPGKKFAIDQANLRVIMVDQ